MKKVSAAIAKASKKVAQQKLPVEMDLRDRSNWYCTLLVRTLALVEAQRATNRAESLFAQIAIHPR